MPTIYLRDRKKIFHKPPAGHAGQGGTGISTFCCKCREHVPPPIPSPYDCSSLTCAQLAQFAEFIFDDGGFPGTPGDPIDPAVWTQGADPATSIKAGPGYAYNSYASETGGLYYLSTATHTPDYSVYDNLSSLYMYAEISLEDPRPYFDTSLRRNWEMLVEARGSTQTGYNPGGFIKAESDPAVVGSADVYASLFAPVGNTGTRHTCNFGDTIGVAIQTLRWFTIGESTQQRDCVSLFINDVLVETIFGEPLSAGSNWLPFNDYNVNHPLQDITIRMHPAFDTNNNVWLPTAKSIYHSVCLYGLDEDAPACNKTTPDVSEGLTDNFAGVEDEELTDPPWKRVSADNPDTKIYYGANNTAYNECLNSFQGGRYTHQVQMPINTYASKVSCSADLLISDPGWSTSDIWTTEAFIDILGDNNIVGKLQLIGGYQVQPSISEYVLGNATGLNQNFTLDPIAYDDWFTCSLTLERYFYEGRTFQSFCYSMTGENSGLGFSQNTEPMLVADVWTPFPYSLYDLRIYLKSPTGTGDPSGIANHRAEVKNYAGSIEYFSGGVPTVRAMSFAGPLGTEFKRLYIENGQSWCSRLEYFCREMDARGIDRVREQREYFTTAMEYAEKIRNSRRTNPSIRDVFDVLLGEQYG